MYIPTLILIISILQLIYATNDAGDEKETWDPLSPLIQTQWSWPAEKQFPSIVRISEKYGKKVYFGKSEANHLITYAMCPNPRTENRLGRYCNYGKSFVTSRYLDEDLLDRCSITVEPAMEKILTTFRTAHESCAFGGHRYRFVYYKRRFLKKTHVYDTCYNKTVKQLVFGYYTIERPSLLRNPLLVAEQDYQFQFETEPFFNDFLNQFIVAKRMYEKNEEYVERMVLPPELLPFALMRKPLFHYMNLAPMDVRILPTWELIMEKLKNKISRMNNSVSITAGLLEVLEDEKGKKKYLRKLYRKTKKNTVIPVHEMPIPKAWWILIYNRKREKGVVIMMVNKPHDESMKNKFHDRGNCSMAICNAANLQKVLPNPTQSQTYIYCCHPYGVTKKYGLSGKNKLLEIP